VRDVQIVVDPEEVLLDLRVPGDRERLVTQELAEDLLCRCHGAGSSWRQARATVEPEIDADRDDSAMSPTAAGAAVAAARDPR